MGLALSEDMIMMCIVVLVVGPSYFFCVSSFSRLVLPGYLIDFGPLLSGVIKTHATSITNTGLLPVSFSIDQSSANDTGFHINLDQVSELPGQESVELEVMFDSNAVTATVTRKVNTQLLIHVCNGEMAFIVC